MSRRSSLRGSDLRGAVRLATDATAGLTDLVEAMHARIARLPGSRPLDLAGRAGGLTGLVYHTICGVTRVVGGTIDSLLGLIAPALDPQQISECEESPEREGLLAALNGVLGDYLAATGNPLAIKMAFRIQGKQLALEPGALSARLPEDHSRLLVVVHGLCMSDVQWRREGHDHGAALAADLGYTAVYLHYNSGLHISINGRSLARELERLLELWPCPAERFALLGHSMGGLVARSAQHYGIQAGHRWPSRLDDMIFLGTPHHGAPFERAGNWVDVILGANPNSAPFARLGKVRSAGITDLRHGNIVDEDWVGRDRFARGADRRQRVALPPRVRYHALAGCLGAHGDLKSQLLGDGLVPLASALGQHANPARALSIPKDRQWVGYRTNHLELLSRPAVYAQLRHSLAKAGAKP